MSRSARCLMLGRAARLRVTLTLTLTLTLLAAMVGFPGTAASAPSESGWYDWTQDGNPDITSVVARSSEDGWHVFAMRIHRSYLFTGEQLHVYIDTDGYSGSEYRLILHQRGDGQSVSLDAAVNGYWMSQDRQNADGTWSSPAGGYFDAAEGYMWVHTSDIGYPENGMNIAAASTASSYGNAGDFAPDSGYWYHGPPTQVGGVSGPGEDEPTGERPDSVPEPPPPSESAAPTPPEPGPAASPTEPNEETSQPALAAPAVPSAKTAVRRLFRHRVPGAAVRTSRCRTGASAVRCKVTARRRGRRWRGTATVRRVGDGGELQAKFTGVTTKRGCEGGCRKRVRWGAG